MSKVWVSEEHLQEIGKALRRRLHSASTFTPAEMSDGIDSIVKGTGGTDVYGHLEPYTVAATATISSGDFVSLDSNDEIEKTSGNSEILGIAKTAGQSGETIEVYLPFE